MAPSLIEHDAKLCQLGVNDLLIKFKAIETNLRKRGHHTTFSEDGISYMQGKADSNEGGLISIAAWVHCFEKRMRNETAPKVKDAHQDKPRARALPQTQTITPPPEWSEDNISRHATDDHVPECGPDSPLCHQHQDEPPVFGDVTHLQEQIQQQQARIVGLEQEVKELEQDIKELEYNEEQDKVLHRHQQAIIVTRERQLLAAKAQHEDLQGRQQARIVVLEEKLRASEEGKLAAEEQVQQLQEQKSISVKDTQAGPTTQDLASKISQLSAQNHTFVCKQDELAESIRQVTSGLYKLSLTQNESMRRAQNEIARIKDLYFLGRGRMAQIEQMVDPHNSDRLRSLTERVGAVEAVKPIVDLHNGSWLPGLAQRVSAAEATIGSLDSWARAMNRR